jgi:hypothetical protein
MSKDGQVGVSTETNSSFMSEASTLSFAAPSQLLSGKSEEQIAPWGHCNPSPLGSHVCPKEESVLHLPMLIRTSASSDTFLSRLNNQFQISHSCTTQQQEKEQPPRYA